MFERDRSEGRNRGDCTMAVNSMPRSLWEGRRFRLPMKVGKFESSSFGTLRGGAGRWRGVYPRNLLCQENIEIISEHGLKRPNPFLTVGCVGGDARDLLLDIGALDEPRVKTL